MPTLIQPSAVDTALLDPQELAAMVAAARNSGGPEAKTDEHRPLGVVLNSPPSE